MPLISQNPGRMDRRITLRYPVASRNAAGESINQWVEVSPIWANWLPQGGREFRSAQARHADVTGIFRIRHRTDVDQTWRLLHGDDLFEVIVPEVVGRRDYLDLICRAIDQTPGYAAIVSEVLNVELLHDSSTVELHDGSLQLLHSGADAPAAPLAEELLEDGTQVLLHDGSAQLLHAA